MPTNKEIAEWLREAASQTTKLSQYQHALGYVKTAEETNEKISTWRERAAQVEQMRCETCLHYQEYWKRVTNYNKLTNCCQKGFVHGQGPDFGCWQWKAKEVE